MNRLLAFAYIFFAAAAAFSQTPEAVERDLLKHLDAISKYGSYGQSYDEEKLNENNTDLKVRLIKFGKRSDVLKYSFSKLKKDMDVATSSDGKFRIYSWDLQTGGTMHDFDCVLQYQGSSGRVRARSCKSAGEYNPGAFYSRIFELRSKTGVIYLANSTFIAEGTTHGQAIEAFRITGDVLDTKPRIIKTNSGLANLISFAYNPFTIEDGDEGSLIRFDAASSSFRFPVVIDDGVSGSGRVTNRFITYKFNGKYFVKVR